MAMRACPSRNMVLTAPLERKTCQPIRLNLRSARLGRTYQRQPTSSRSICCSGLSRSASMPRARDSGGRRRISRSRLSAAKRSTAPRGFVAQAKFSSVNVGSDHNIRRWMRWSDTNCNDLTRVSRGTSTRRVKRTACAVDLACRPARGVFCRLATEPLPFHDQRHRIDSHATPGPPPTSPPCTAFGRATLSSADTDSPAAYFYRRAAGDPGLESFTPKVPWFICSNYAMQRPRFKCISGRRDLGCPRDAASDNQHTSMATS